MVFSFKYWQIVTLTGSGQRQVKKSEAAWEGLQDESISRLAKLIEIGKADERDIQTSLLKMSQSDEDLTLKLRLCLRCWLSHQIAHACDRLATQFGYNYGFISADLWPFVLDDDGSLNPSYQPFTEKILKGYDPTKLSLGAWANRITKNDPRINRFLLDRGLYRVSDWAILNDTPTDRLARIFPRLGKGPLTETIELLDKYHQVYRRERLYQRQKIGRTGRCNDPTPQQLRQIGEGLSPEVVLYKLRELAAKLRNHRIEVRRGTPMTHSLEKLEASGYHPSTDQYDSNELTQDNFLQCYREDLMNSLSQSIRSVTLSYVEAYQSRRPYKGQLFLTALQLFHCQGLSMNAIAQELGLNSQVQVTRLLKLRRFRTEICADWFNQLKSQVEDAALQHITPEKLTHISNQLEEFLREETDAIIAAAAAEAQIPRNRGTCSLFARSLCAELAQIEI